MRMIGPGPFVGVFSGGSWRWKASSTISSADLFVLRRGLVVESWRRESVMLGGLVRSGERRCLLRSGRMISPVRARVCERVVFLYLLSPFHHCISSARVEQKLRVVCPGNICTRKFGLALGELRNDVGLKHRVLRPTPRLSLALSPFDRRDRLRCPRRHSSTATSELHSP